MVAGRKPHRRRRGSAAVKYVSLSDRVTFAAEGVTFTLDEIPTGVNVEALVLGKFVQKVTTATESAVDGENDEE